MIRAVIHRTARPLRLAVVIGATIVALAGHGGDLPRAEAATSACSIRSVTVKRVLPYGTSFFVLYHTTAPVRTWLTVHRAGAKDILATSARWSWHQGAPASPSVLGTRSGLELEPGTRYDYVLMAEDAGGCRFYARGTARTQRRLVEVTFDKALVTDDGDNGGSGELYVDTRVHEEVVPAVFSNRSLSAPSTLSLGKTMKVADVPATFSAYVRIADDDHTYGFDWCGTDAARTWGNGSNRCWDWTTSRVDITVPANGQAGKGTFTTFAPGSPSFQLTGRWSVRYVP